MAVNTTEGIGPFPGSGTTGETEGATGVVGAGQRSTIRKVADAARDILEDPRTKRGLVMLGAGARKMSQASEEGEPEFLYKNPFLGPGRSF